MLFTIQKVKKDASGAGINFKCSGKRRESPVYSLLKLFTGFSNAALIAWYPTVRSESTMHNPPASAHT